MDYFGRWRHAWWLNQSLKNWYHSYFIGNFCSGNANLEAYSSLLVFRRNQFSLRPSCRLEFIYFLPSHQTCCLDGTLAVRGLFGNKYEKATLRLLSKCYMHSWLVYFCGTDNNNTNQGLFFQDIFIFICNLLSLINNLPLVKTSNENKMQSNIAFLVLYSGSSFSK